RALAATAFAFQARLWLLSLCDRRASARRELARALEARNPSQATVFVDHDIESEVPSTSLREGHLFRLSPGQIVPADGFVTFGSGFVDESLLAGGGEDLQMKGMGSLVYAGTRNKNGALLVRATAVGTWTLLSRLAAHARLGLEQSLGALGATDAVLTFTAAAALMAYSGAPAALRAFLVASGAGCLALLASFEADCAALSAARRWLWGPDGIRRLNACGILVTPAGGVLSEGRLRLAAVECSSKLSEDAVLGLLAPLARKLETPAAFALLLELRARNIPLQQSEFFQPQEGGGMAIVAGEEIRWLAYDSARSLPLGPLDAFVTAHENAGDEVHLLERQGIVAAAVAFHDEPVKGASEAAGALKAIGFPVLLVSRLPRRAISRLQTGFGIDHAQGETGTPETEVLMNRLTAENLAPIWVQKDAFRPAAAAGLVALPAAPGSADLVLPSLHLPEIASALAFARNAGRALRLGLGWLLSCQAGLLFVLLGADARIASLLRLGSGWRLSEGTLALAALIPVFLAHVLVRQAFPGERALAAGESAPESV
ncbi:MAG: P-type ATPase, partial [Bdellovibrionota bacterium]